MNFFCCFCYPNWIEILIDCANEESSNLSISLFFVDWPAFKYGNLCINLFLLKNILPNITYSLVKYLWYLLIIFLFGRQRLGRMLYLLINMRNTSLFLYLTSKRDYIYILKNVVYKLVIWCILSINSSRLSLSWSQVGVVERRHVWLPNVFTLSKNKSSLPPDN